MVENDESFVTITTMSKTHILLISIVAAAILIFAGLWFFQGGGKSGDTATTTGETTSIRDEDSGIEVKFEGEEGVTINTIPADIKPPAVPHPDLDHVVQFASNFPEIGRSAVRNNIDGLIAELQDDPQLAATWFNLGLQYKKAGDYEATRDAWEYVILLAPTNVVTLNNLGNLYHLHLRNYVKAESNFLSALVNNPNNPSAYFGLHELYRYSYKTETTLAADTLKDGLTVLVGDVNLLVTLASYYRDTADTTNAKKYFEEVLVIASTNGDIELVNAIKAEIEKL